MKWKRSRKAQQDSKNNKDNEEKSPREKSSSTFKNEKITSNRNNIQFPNKNIVCISSPHSVLANHQQPGNSKELFDENYTNNLISRQGSVFNENEEKLWRVV